MSMKNKIVKTIIFFFDNIHLWCGIFFLIRYFVDFNNKETDIFIIDLIFTFTFTLTWGINRLNQKINDLKQESLKEFLRISESSLRIIKIEKELEYRITLLEMEKKQNDK